MAGRRTFRDEFEALLGRDPSRSRVGDDFGGLVEELGRSDLPDELVNEALFHFAVSAPPSVAARLYEFVESVSPLDDDGVTASPNVGLTLLATSPPDLPSAARPDGTPVPHAVPYNSAESDASNHGRMWDDSAGSWDDPADGDDLDNPTVDMWPFSDDESHAILSDAAAIEAPDGHHDWDDDETDDSLDP